MRINQFTTIIVVILAIVHTQVQAATPPYPQSSLISGVEWDFTSPQTSIGQKVARGSDLWSITWADDGALYTGWGDGGGFGGTNSDGRVSLGVGVVTGPPDNLQASNIFGGKNPATAATFDGKPTGLLSVGGTLYMGVVEEGQWLRLKIGRSTDHGQTWVFNSTDWSSDAGWDFAETDGAFSDLVFLQFGQDYAGARDNYVYAYSQDKRAYKPRPNIAMFRVPKDQLMERAAYEYFAGLDGNKNPLWTTDISQRQAVFSDPNGVGFGVRVVYNAGLKRYFLTTWHAEDGSWGIFDAPEPWGPWTTVAYYDQWEGTDFKFGFAFPTKWMTGDGKSFVMVFSGTGPYDDWCTLKGRFVMAGGSDTTPPTAPANLAGTAVNGSQIDLSWTAATDPESSIVNYNIYRDSSQVGIATGTTYRDSGLAEGTSYSYQVTAVNSAGLESSMSNTVSVTTSSDLQPPEIVSVSATTATKLKLVFDEAVTTLSAEQTSNYAITDGVGIISAELQADQRTVFLSTTALTANIDYTITVNNISDRSAAKNIILADSQATFVLTESDFIGTTLPARYEWDVLETGKKVYVDRSFNYTTIPTTYSGEKYLRTANDDKFASGEDSILFDVTQSVKVFVGFDVRNTTIPAWLTDWENTGQTVSSNDSVLQLYSKSFAAGSVSLGGNEVGNSMYVVLVVADEGSPSETGNGGGSDSGDGGDSGDGSGTSTPRGGGGALNITGLLLLMFILFGRIFQRQP